MREFVTSSPSLTSSHPNLVYETPGLFKLDQSAPARVSLPLPGAHTLVINVSSEEPLVTMLLREQLMVEAKTSKQKKFKFLQCTLDRVWLEKYILDIPSYIPLAP